MANPFKPDDKVQTKVKGTIVDAVVRLVWNDEVQVRTPDNALLWRSDKRVWYPGAAPQVEVPKAANGEQPRPGGAEQNAPAHSEPTAGHQAATPEHEAGVASSPTTAVDPSPPTPAGSDSPASVEFPQPRDVGMAHNVTSCGVDEIRPVNRKTRKTRKKK